MTETNLPTSEKSETPHKEAVILAGGVIDKKSYEEDVKKLAEDNDTSQIADVHRKTHTDLIALRIQSYEKRDLPSTQIDDAFRMISGYGNLADMPKNFPITREQINELTYEMLISLQAELISLQKSDSMTAKDVQDFKELLVGNPEGKSLENFLSILQFMPPGDEIDEQSLREVQVIGGQFARDIIAKRKAQTSE